MQKQMPNADPFAQDSRYEDHHRLWSLVNSSASSLDEIVRGTALTLFKKVLWNEFANPNITKVWLEDLAYLAYAKQGEPIVRSLEEAGSVGELLSELYEPQVGDFLLIIKSLHTPTIYSAIHKINVTDPQRIRRSMHVLIATAMNSGAEYPLLPSKFAEILAAYPQEIISRSLITYGMLGLSRYGVHDITPAYYTKLISLDTTLPVKEFKKHLGI